MLQRLLWTGPCFLISLTQKNACPINKRLRRSGFACTIKTSLPITLTSFGLANFLGSPGIIRASILRTSLFLPFFTTGNSKTMVPPTFYQYRSSIGVSLLFGASGGIFIFGRLNTLSLLEVLKHQLLANSLPSEVHLLVDVCILYPYPENHHLL